MKDKNSFRSYCKKRLFRFKKHNNYLLERKVKKIIDILEAKNILLFVPMAHEPKLNGLFKLRGKKNIFVPFMEGKSFKMVKYRLPLKSKKFGIKEPLNSFFKRKIDLAVVPVIGVDGDFKRVGFGKGMYDRFFSKLSYRPKILFLQKTLCFTKAKVTDSFDIQGDILVTPKKIIIRGNKDVDRDFSWKLCRHFKRSCRIYTVKKNRKR